VKTCGHPKIQNIMENITVKPGDKAVFNCKVGSHKFSSKFILEMANSKIRSDTADTAYSAPLH
jgi:dihydroxyacetone kinase DhaKLM complex PTS-EIIA-like component DhaM